ncbi:MAG TPA: hypothetical protein VJA21_10930 [Verrucomicrobiae bacterium]
MEVVDQAYEGDSWQILEKAWIEFGLAMRWPLTNERPGGDGRYAFGDVELWKKRIGDSLRGKKRSPRPIEVRQKISRTMLEKKAR